MHNVVKEGEEGEELLMPIREEHEIILGADDKTTSECRQIWRAMGNIRNAQQRHRKALEYHEWALENTKVINGEKHYYTGVCFTA